MAKLDYNEILKYDSRQVMFYEMLRSGTPFEVSFDEKTIHGTAVIEKLFYKKINLLIREIE